MTIENLNLFQAMSAKMNYLAERQKVISQNVANADTPGYVSQDLKKVDFGRMVAKITQDHKSISMAADHAGHMLPNGMTANPQEQKNRTPYEVSPDGNAVVLEEQMVRSSQNQMDYNMMLNLYASNVDMLRTAVGKNK